MFRRIVRDDIVRVVAAALALSGAALGLPSTVVADDEVPMVRLEAEQFTVAPNSGAGRFVTEAGTAQHIGLWYGGASAAASFTLDAPRTGLNVIAWADPCEGWPDMTVTVDGVQIGRVTVSTSYNGSYMFPGTWPAGQHTVTVAFTNDRRTGTCDRNFKLHAVQLGVPRGLDSSTVYLNPRDFTLAPSAGTFFNWGERGQDGMVIWSNAAASTDVWVQHATRMIIYLGNDACQGWPRMSVRVDGELVSELDVPYKHLPAVLTGDWGTGWHHIELALVNDLKTASCDRNLKVYEMWLDAPSSA